MNLKCLKNGKNKLPNAMFSINNGSSNKYATEVDIISHEENLSKSDAMIFLEKSSDKKNTMVLEASNEKKSTKKPNAMTFSEKASNKKIF